MDFLFDIEIWVGLSTLIILEIVLGIDNLVFIAILADKLPEKLRDKARITGLILALGMRLILLAFISRLITLTQPLFDIFGHDFSGRDLILFGGGAFLLYKATSEIHGRIEGHGHGPDDEKSRPKFWVVVSQIVVLDAVFSLDAVITAVGMVEHLLVMQAAVIIAMAMMIFASKSLTKFVNAHPTVIMLCLSFLLMVGFSLMADGLGFHVPKGYLYAAIGFSILIEALNQTSMIRRRSRIIEGSDRRQRTADAVLRMLSGRPGGSAEMAEDVSTLVKLGQDAGPVFSGMERKMISGVLTLTERPIRSIMTPRPDLVWIDLDDPMEKILEDIRSTAHSTLLVSRGNLDEIVGVMRKADFLSRWVPGEIPDIAGFLRPPLSLHDNLSVLKALKLFKETPVSLAIVVDEYGSIEGLVTLNDIIQTIAGHIPNEHDDGLPEFKTQHDGTILIDGMASIYDVREKLNLGVLPEDGFSTLAGFILYRLGHLPKEGETMDWPGWHFTVVQMEKNKILKVRAQQIPEED